ncbi:ammonium transporter, partial [Nocardia sp. CT2-14]|nr:ammonium transporter [Nocardia aurantiaca]
MKLHTLALTAFSAAAAVTVSAATAAAAPETAAAPVSYHAAMVGDSVFATLRDGTFELAADRRSVTVSDALGHVLDTLPLAAEVDGRQLPIRPEISGDARTLTL